MATSRFSQAQVDAALAELDLAPGAPAEDVKAAYTDLVKVWHPDRFTHESERLRTRAAAKLQRINDAFAKLRSAMHLGGLGAQSLTRIPLDFGGRWGYIDETGAPAIYPDFAEARAFREGLAAAKLVEKWGYLDLQGEFVINPVYEECGDFAEGLAAVKWYGRWGYIDREGRFVVQPRYQTARPFVNGTGEVQLGSRWGRVSRSGQVTFTEADPSRRVDGVD
jgi:hypothetical protein